ncbi:MAG: radical SAM protein [Patescibacteria group bacterium]
MNIKSSTKQAVLELTTACNLNCKHCFYSKKNIGEFLEKERAFKIIDRLKENKVNKLVLTGGEPTLHPHIIEIAEYARTKIKKVTLCSNGVIKNKETKKKIIDFNFDTYTVSIDSHINRVHDGFRGQKGALQEVLNFTDLLFKGDKNISIHITLHPWNVDHIDKTIEYVKRFNSEIIIGSIYYKRTDLNDRMMSNYFSAIQNIKKRYINDNEIILVGFCRHCHINDCPDQKQLFIINKSGEPVSCYWKKGGGKLLKNINYENIG